MKRRVIFLFHAALVIGAVFLSWTLGWFASRLNAKTEIWEAYSEGSCKPGNAYILRKKANSISGDFYLTDPNAPRDLSKAMKCSVSNLSFKNRELSFVITVFPDDPQPIVNSARLRFKNGLSGDSDEAAILDANGNVCYTIGFVKKETK